MKKIYFTLLFTIVSIVGYSQEDKTPSIVESLPSQSVDDNSIYNTSGLESKPEFKGGITEFYKFVSKNYQTPGDKNFKGGKVLVTFVIEKDGSVTDIKVLRDCGFGTGEEAKRVFALCPKWVPGEQNGKKVRTQFTLPISLPGN